MKSQITAGRIVGIVVAVLIAAAIANYDKLLPHSWTTYTAPDGSFSIELPGKPEVATTQSPLEGGGSIPMTMISAQPAESTVYTCTYAEDASVLTKSPDQVLEGARDGSLRKTQGTLISQERKTVQGFPALDMRTHARGNSLVDARFILVGKRLYMIVAVATIERDREPRTIQRVIESFKIIKP